MLTRTYNSVSIFIVLAISLIGFNPYPIQANPRRAENPFDTIKSKTPANVKGWTAFRDRAVSGSTGVMIRLNEKLPERELRARFKGYSVDIAYGEDCLICASIQGKEGNLSIDFNEQWLLIRISLFDGARDEFGNRVGEKLGKAARDNPLTCDSGEQETCVSPFAPSIHYIIEGDCKPLVSIPDGRVYAGVCKNIIGITIKNN
jgi:hypothetical protein